LVTKKVSSKSLIPDSILEFMKEIMPEERYYHLLADRRIGFITSQLPIDSGVGMVQDGDNFELLLVEKSGDQFISNEHPVIFKGWVVSLVTVIK